MPKYYTAQRSRYHNKANASYQDKSKNSNKSHALLFSKKARKNQMYSMPSNLPTMLITSGSTEHQNVHLLLLLLLLSGCMIPSTLAGEKEAGVKKENHQRQGIFAKIPPDLKPGHGTEPILNNEFK